MSSPPRRARGARAALARRAAALTILVGAAGAAACARAARPEGASAVSAGAPTADSAAAPPVAAAPLPSPLAATPEAAHASAAPAATQTDVRVARRAGVRADAAREMVGTTAAAGRPAIPRAAHAGGDREQYDRIDDNPFLAVAEHRRSTFSLDVDRASYANVRRFLTAGTRPPVDAVRIEELVNYFPYVAPAPTRGEALAVTTEVAPAPWRPEHRLVRVAVQARRPAADERRPANLVFLVDVSGSMMDPDKLPLVKQALGVLVDRLRPEDRVALVAYAGAAGLVLPSTPGSARAEIRAAIERLEAGGSTAGGAGLALAYRVAQAHAGPGVNSRVVLATDGDFNVGPSSDAEMERLVEARRAEGTALTVLGFGTGNLQDAKMKKLAKRGDGNYAYVDGLAEARKVFGQELAGTLETVANDAKVQVEFNRPRCAPTG
jgi:Ca-activated chloride channel family protein